MSVNAYNSAGTEENFVLLIFVEPLQSLGSSLSQSRGIDISHLFKYFAKSEVFAAAAACRPKFKLRWVADSHEDFMKEAFLYECKTIVSACVVNDEDRCPASQPVDNDDFFDLDDQPGQAK